MAEIKDEIIAAQKRLADERDAALARAERAEAQVQRVRGVLSLYRVLQDGRVRADGVVSALDRALDVEADR